MSHKELHVEPAPASCGSRYDLAVAYRIYPRVSAPSRSLPFSDEKLRQAEICLRSFRNSLGSLRVKIWAILDGCPPEYRVLFERIFDSKDLVLVELDKVGNGLTFSRQLDILLSQQDSEFVYFAEDDYLYLPEQFTRMLEFLRDEPGVDFVSPYDHLDCYRLDLHDEPKWLRVREGHHWRTAASTCLTFLSRRSTLGKFERVLRTYTHGNTDCSVWLSLTKRRVFSPIAFFQHFAQKEFYRNVVVKAWFYCWSQILFGPTAMLWVPIPGIATHLSAGLLSPGTDWITLMGQEAEQGVGPGSFVHSGNNYSSSSSGLD